MYDPRQHAIHGQLPAAAADKEGNTGHENRAADDKQENDEDDHAGTPYALNREPGVAPHSTVGRHAIQYHTVKAHVWAQEPLCFRESVTTISLRVRQKKDLQSYHHASTA